MILTNLNDFSRYVALNPGFAALSDYLSGHNLLSEETGRIVVDGDNVFINNISVKGLAIPDQPLEMHRGYIDVHILLEGDESIGIKQLRDVESFSGEYDEAGDCLLSKERASNYIRLKPGDMLVCFPEDAHAPAIGPGTIRKAIAKVRVR